MVHRSDVGRVFASLLTALWLAACGGALPVGEAKPAADAGAPSLAVSDAGPDAPALPPLDVHLDPSFGMVGNVGGSLALWTPAGVAVDAHGRVVVSGPGQDPTTAPVQEVVRRFNDDGTLDSTFGASGAVILPFDSYEWAQADRALSNGIGILGAAAFDGGQAAFAIRLAADGAADSTFAGAPLYAPSVGPFSAGLWEDDGSGFLLGAQGVARFAPNGVLDATYGAGTTMAPAAAGALAADGRLWTASGSRVSRYLANGALDPAFGQAGSVDLPPVGPDAVTIETVLPQPNGAAVVVASHPDGNSFDVDVVRITDSGDIDSAFAEGRFVSVRANGAPAGAAQLADGRVAVWTSYGDLVAIEPDGTLEPTSLLNVEGTVLAATIDPSQRLVIVGMVTADPLDNMWFVRRYLLL